MDTNEPKLSYAQLLERFDQIEAENKRVKAELATAQASRKPGTLTLKARKRGEKYTNGKGVERTATGVASLYGVGSFPVSLYYSQWDALLKNAGKIREQLEALVANGTITKEKATT